MVLVEGRQDGLVFVGWPTWGRLVPQDGCEVNRDGRVKAIFFNAAKAKQVLIFVC